VTPRSRISAASRGGECSVCGGARITRAPPSSGMNMSITDTSKVNAANPRTALEGSIRQAMTMPCRKLIACRCSTTTPFGCPVDPEV
jgi:hypothetical protein